MGGEWMRYRDRRGSTTRAARASVYHRFSGEPANHLRIRVDVRAFTVRPDRRGGLLDQLHDLVALPFRLILGELLDTNGNQLSRVEAGSGDAHGDRFDQLLRQ